ncbi:MAG: non-canonical purine pyrophosphatase, rdgB/HAM1 family [Phycisphaerales bacterium]|nr:non-canonical purine pyrophosphatase, rdgB/HAM1 family [Phycisphaerales bacterium]
MKLPPIVVVATHNRGKVAEFAHMLGGDGDAAQVEWRDLSAYPNIGEVEETGDTFRANACLKAAEYAKLTGQWALADDSGLEVDALGNKPGVTSARWAALHGESSPAGKDADNNALLLKQLDAVPDEARTARFVCVLALADEKGRIILTARDTVEGRIIREPRGTNGFGYDPLFHVDALGKTTAELSPAEKADISHRGRALRRLKGLIATTASGSAADGIEGNS